MEKKEQTEAVKLQLYQLTELFVKKYVHRYYKQFTGELDDLVSSYYLEFLTPKSRERGKEQSLLDKFDDKITTLPYLVKVSVQRKLIDSSRQNPYSDISIDGLIEEYGDVINNAFGTCNTQDNIEEQIENKEFSFDEVTATKKAFVRLSEGSKKSFIEQFKEVRNVIAPAYRMLFDEIVGPLEVESKEEKEIKVEVEIENNKIVCDVQRITPKTIVAYVVDRFINFSREDGKARVARDSGYQCISFRDLEGIEDYKGLTKEDFLKRYIVS